MGPLCRVWFANICPTCSPPWLPRDQIVRLGRGPFIHFSCEPCCCCEPQKHFAGPEAPKSSSSVSFSKCVLFCFARTCALHSESLLTQRRETGLRVHFLAWGAPFVENSILPPLNCFCSFIQRSTGGNKAKRNKLDHIKLQSKGNWQHKAQTTPRTGGAAHESRT